MTAQHPARPAPPRGRPKRPPRDQRVHVLTVRVPEELLRRLDAYTARVQAAQPYLRLSRTDVLRMLLDKGLSARLRPGSSGLCPYGVHAALCILRPSRRFTTACEGALHERTACPLRHHQSRKEARARPSGARKRIWRSCSVSRR